MKLNYNLLAATIVITCGFCFIAILHYTSFERHHTHDWPHYQSYTAEETSNQSDVSKDTPVSDANRIKAFNSSNPSQRQNAYTSNESLQHYDHKAQIIMAIATSLGLVVAISGLIMIWRTLIATQGAAKSASDTLSVARETIKVTRKTGIAQTRAFISVGIKPIKVMDDTQAVNTTVIITNHGATPGKIVKVKIMATRGIMSLPVKINFPESVTPNTHILFPSITEHMQMTLDIEAGTINSLKQSNGSIHIAAFISYMDVYGITRRTIAYNIGRSINQDGTIAFYPAKRGNRAS